MGKRKLKERLFQYGARAANHVFGFNGTYVCPLCGRQHGMESLRSGFLTLEHVPPSKQGGRGILLTCKPCNNVTGATVDAALSRRSKVKQSVRRILGDGMGFAGHYTLHEGSAYITGELYKSKPKEITFRVREELCDPAAIERIAPSSGSRSDLKRARTIELRSREFYCARHAAIGDLKSAFLITAAALGYRFALAPSLLSVRRQILAPDDQIVDVLSKEMSPHLEPPRLYMLEDLTGFLVHLSGNQAIYLPWPSQWLPDELPDPRSRGTSERAYAHLLDWPTSFEARMDSECSRLPRLNLTAWSDKNESR